ncbi:MAG: hypothetical protein N2112_04245 [Gemmataceae bacterium]|jgi:hypothetical protein|nr:hypothetical protein [Gemmataceae bacterium]
MCRKKRNLIALILLLLLPLSAGAVWFFLLRDQGDPQLNAYVQNAPPVAIVFTSRSEPVSLRAGAHLGDYSATGQAIRGSGQPQWQAREGRLRLLNPSGKVRELTWGKKLPDGGTLIDVMSPSVSPNGRTVYFAGRQAEAHGGRFRIYAVDIDGSNLRQITGLAEDSGCVNVPPLRFDAQGNKLNDEARKRLDYDDIDPTALPDGTVIFASSRLPDTGGRDRRATQIWIKEPKGTPRPLTANRANDRWPYLASDRSIIFSLWSYQPEVISLDGTGIVRHSPPRAELTAPVDRWLGATITPSGEQFSQVLKLVQPVWRPRPLMNGNIVCMTPEASLGTPFTPENETPETKRFYVMQAPHGSVTSAPSSLGVGSTLPEPADVDLRWLVGHDSQKRPLSLATPSPAPNHQIVLAGAPVIDGKVSDYGLYLAGTDHWANSPDGTPITLTPLFDDPNFIDAEPVAVYVRPIENGPIRTPVAWPADLEQEIHLSSGKTYKGPAAKIEARQLGVEVTGLFRGQTPKSGVGPIIPQFPPSSIKKIVLYASHRDRYDDPEQPVVRGSLERLLEANTRDSGQDGMFETKVPIGSPTLLMGIGADGKVVRVVSPTNATFYAYAGDHVSGARAGGYHFCTGCHTGHTFTGNDIAEKVR